MQTYIFRGFSLDSVQNVITLALETTESEETTDNESKLFGLNVLPSQEESKWLYVYPSETCTGDFSNLRDGQSIQAEIIPPASWGDCPKMTQFTTKKTQSGSS